MSIRTEDQIAALTALAEKVKVTLDKAKAEYLASHRVKNRSAAMIGGEDAGSVTVAAGAESWQLVDEAAMLAWAMENADHLVSWKPKLDPDSMKVLKSSKRGPVDDDGSVLPGWELRTGEPGVRFTRPPGVAPSFLMDLVERAIAEGSLSFADMLAEIEGPAEEQENQA